MAWYNELFKSTTSSAKGFLPVAFGRKNEAFTGQVTLKPFRGFGEKVGEEHPFNPAITEGLYKKFGLVTGVVDKYVDYIWGSGFHITCEESGGEKAITIVNDWIRETQFGVVGRQWVKEALIKQGGFMELGGAKNKPIEGVKVLDAKYMYVRRDDKGTIQGYTQYVGGFNQFSPSKAIFFEPFQIAALHFNCVGDSAYGLGIVHPNCGKIDQLLGLDRDVHTIIHRKANNPLHIKLGSNDPANPYIPSEEAIEAFREDLQTLTEKTEWVTDSYCDIKSVDTGNIGEKFDATLKHDVDMLIFGFQVPEVLLGRGSIPEGLAQVQADAFERRVSSFQEEIEKVLETQVFNRVLQAAGLDLKVEVVWGQPSSKEKNERIAQIQLLLGLMALQPKMRYMLEVELADLMGLDSSELEEPSEEMERELDEPTPKVPGQNGPEERMTASTVKNTVTSQTPSAVEESTSTTPEGRGSNLVHNSNDSPSLPNPFEEEATVEAWLGFNYKEYLNYIISSLRKDGFEMLAASTEEQVRLGKFSNEQVEALKDVLSSSFKEGSNMRTIAERIKTEVKPKDLLIIDEEGTARVVSSAQDRPMAIARSETTRMAALGTTEYYKDNGVQEYRWVASVGKRTCPQCEAMNGRTFSVSEAPALPPLHTNCRCTVSAVTRLG